MPKYPAVPALSFQQRLLFWGKVQRGAPDECWLWLGARGRAGRGQVRINGVVYTASRVALALSTGVNLLGLVARHSCDNPPCCNPAHLSASTQSENIVEAFGKGRMSPPGLRGERCGKSKLTQVQVDEIRSLFLDPTMDNATIGAIYQVSKCTIRCIRLGLTWVQTTKRHRRTRR